MSPDEERKHADMVHEASLPVSEQEYVPIEYDAELDPRAAQFWPGTPDKANHTYDMWHLLTLLRIVVGVCSHDVAWAVYRCWQAYSAGFRGCKYLESPGTATAYWYMYGRTQAKEVRKVDPDAS